MFKTHDPVTVHLSEEAKNLLEDTLETDFHEIYFYSIEQEDEDYAVLSAETSLGMAVIRCPLAQIEGYEDDVAIAEELIHHVLNTLVMDHALDTGNKELFEAIHAYNKECDPEEKVVPTHIYIDAIPNMFV